MIIFLKSEVAKYQNEISTLKNIDYSMVISLEQEISQLETEKKEISLELMKTKKTFEKKLSDLHENIQLRENQRIKLISSIEALVKKNEALQKENRKLKNDIEKKKIDGTSSTQNLSPQISNDYIKPLENIENTLRVFIQKNDQQLAAIYEGLIKNRNEAVDINQHLLKEIQNKSTKIETLLKKDDALKEPAPLNNKVFPNSDTHSYLDNKIQKLLVQTVNFEAELDEKLSILNNLEYELFELENKIHKQESDEK